MEQPWNPNQTPVNPPQQPPQAPPHTPYAQHPGQYPAVTPPDSSQDPLYEHLNISKGEHVIREVRRHIIGVLQIYVVAVLAILGILIGTGALLSFASKPQDIIDGTAIAIPAWAIIGVGGVLTVLAVVITMIAIKVFYGNRLYLTTESVIQRIQTSLFHTKEQQITLGNIEDASYERRGILQQMLNYGTIRLSTEGEETTYYFHYAVNPKFEVGQIIQAQENFNNLNPSGKH